MTLKPSHRSAAIILMSFLLLCGADGCSRSRSNDTLVFPRITGHYTGPGSYTETNWAKAPRLNIVWQADFERQTDSTFIGTMRSTYIDQNTTMTGESMQWGVRGNLTRSHFIVIEETSMVRPKSPKWIFGDQQFLTSFDSCTFSTNGDTVFYRGPSPQSETFVLIRQK